MIPGKDIQDMQTLQRNGRTRHTSLKKLHSDNTCLYGFPVMPISSKILLTDFHILSTPVFWQYTKTSLHLQYRILADELKNIRIGFKKRNTEKKKLQYDENKRNTRTTPDRLSG